MWCELPVHCLTLISKHLSNPQVYYWFSCPPHTLDCSWFLRSLLASLEMRKLKCVLWTLPTMRSLSVTTRSQRWGRSSRWRQDTLLMFVCVCMSTDWVNTWTNWRERGRWDEWRETADRGNRGENMEMSRRTRGEERSQQLRNEVKGWGVLYVQINRILCYLSLAVPAHFWPPAGHLPSDGRKGKFMFICGGGGGHYLWWFDICMCVPIYQGVMVIKRWAINN